MGYVSFPWLLEQITTNFMAKNNTHVKCYNSGGQGSKMEVLIGCVAPGGSGGKSISLPFLLLEAAHVPQLASIFKAGNHVISSASYCHISPLALTFLPPSSTNKDPCDYIGLTKILYDNLPSQGQPSSNLTPSVQTPTLRCDVTSSQVLGLGTWTALGAIIPPTMDGNP